MLFYRRMRAQCAIIAIIHRARYAQLIFSPNQNFTRKCVYLLFDYHNIHSPHHPVSSHRAVVRCNRPYPSICNRARRSSTKISVPNHYLCSLLVVCCGDGPRTRRVDQGSQVRLHHVLSDFLPTFHCPHDWKTRLIQFFEFYFPSHERHRLVDASVPSSPKFEKVGCTAGQFTTATTHTPFLFPRISLFIPSNRVHLFLRCRLRPLVARPSEDVFESFWWCFYRRKLLVVFLPPATVSIPGLPLTMLNIAA
jgi:hypothetical protein